MANETKSADGAGVLDTFGLALGVAAKDVEPLPQRARATSSTSDGGDYEGTHVKSRQYEYLDHTADVQLHTWGDTMKECFEQVALAMFGYMTEMDKVEIDPACTRVIECTAHDMQSLLFHYLDEFLVNFATTDFIPKDVKILEFDLEKWRIKVAAKGEKFSLDKHPQGTEVKAITYSAMQIRDKPDDDGKVHIYVIVDI